MLVIKYLIYYKNFRVSVTPFHKKRPDNVVCVHLRVVIRQGV